MPYTAKASGLATFRHRTGSSILTVGAVQPGDAPTWGAATSFLSAYLAAVRKALVAALLISAAVQALVPTNWLVRLMNRRGRIGSAAMGGLLSTPSTMCTCCTAPVATTLRRGGVRTSAAVAYWLGDPLLNPAVLVFLVLVAPWQWTAVRLAVGIALVVGGAALVERLTTERVEPSPAALVGTAMVIPTAGEPDPAGPRAGRTVPREIGALLVTLPAVSLPGIAMVGRALGSRGPLPPWWWPAEWSPEACSPCCDGGTTTLQHRRFQPSRLGRRPGPTEGRWARFR